MENKPELIITPMELQQSEALTVRSNYENFTQRNYTITDENGKIIRKGSVNEHISEFKLCMLGLTTGVYHFTMGQFAEKFVVTS